MGRLYSNEHDCLNHPDGILHDITNFFTYPALESGKIQRNLSILRPNEVAAFNRPTPLSC